MHLAPQPARNAMGIPLRCRLLLALLLALFAPPTFAVFRIDYLIGDATVSHECATFSELKSYLQQLSMWKAPVRTVRVGAEHELQPYSEADIDHLAFCGLTWRQIDPGTNAGMMLAASLYDLARQRDPGVQVDDFLQGRLSAFSTWAMALRVGGVPLYDEARRLFWQHVRAAGVEQERGAVEGIFQARMLIGRRAAASILSQRTSAADAVEAQMADGKEAARPAGNETEAEVMGPGFVTRMAPEAVNATDGIAQPALAAMAQSADASWCPEMTLRDFTALLSRHGFTADSPHDGYIRFRERSGRRVLPIRFERGHVSASTVRRFLRMIVRG